MKSFESVLDLLKWFVYSGGAILVASWVWEHIAVFQTWIAETKKLVIMGSSIILAFIAYALITYLPAAIFTMLDPYFLIAAGIVVMYSGMQVVHQLTKPLPPV
jgi:hypothetical protein